MILHIVEVTESWLGCYGDTFEKTITTKYYLNYESAKREYEKLDEQYNNMEKHDGFWHVVSEYKVNTED